MGEAQAQRPEVYEHEDGSVYRGQWKGQSKHGLGTYRCRLVYSTLASPCAQSATMQQGRD